MTRKLSSEEKAKLKAEFIGKAQAGFEEMFGDGKLDEHRTFVQKDEKAYEIVGGLWQWMMEKHLEQDERTCEVEAKCLCPHCGGIGRRREKDKGSRDIVGKHGLVGFEREGFYCGRCRKVFFPSGPKA